MAACVTAHLVRPFINGIGRFWKTVNRRQRKILGRFWAFWLFSRLAAVPSGNQRQLALPVNLAVSSTRFRQYTLRPTNISTEQIV
jgi:hypothetical protein